MPRFVGVDAGGSSTIAVASGDRDERHVASGEPANVRSGGIERAATILEAAIRDALEGDSAQAIFAGVAGAGDETIAKSLRAALALRFPGTPIGVSDDAHIALRAAVPDGDGMVLVAGTGSIAYAEIGGAIYRTGGYGYLLGDEGSGFAIGSAALRWVLRSYDGRATRDAMVEAIERELGIGDGQSAIAAVYRAGQPVATVASLASIVLAHAGNGERSATKIVQNAAADLFDLLKALSKNASVGSRQLPVVFAGGLLRANTLLSYLIETRLSHELPFLEPRKNASPPHEGALACARALASGSVTSPKQ